MSDVITTATALSCTFQGSVSTTNPKPAKLVVGGSDVLLASGVPTWSVTACGAQAGGSASPCVSVGPPTAGISTKLHVNDAAVLLSSFSAPAVGSAVTAGHTIAVTVPPGPPPPAGPLAAA